MVMRLQGACCRTSYFPPHLLKPTFSFSVDLSIGIGCSTTAPTACEFLPRCHPLGILPGCGEGGESALLYLLRHAKFRFATSLLTQPSIAACPRRGTPPLESPQSFTTGRRTEKVSLKPRVKIFNTASCRKATCPKTTQRSQDASTSFAPSGALRSLGPLPGSLGPFPLHILHVYYLCAYLDLCQTAFATGASVDERRREGGEWIGLEGHRCFRCEQSALDLIPWHT